MKYILILVAIFFFIAYQQETSTTEYKTNLDAWNLGFFHKVKIQDEELYNCVYFAYSRSFSILSNTACKEKLQKE